MSDVLPFRADMRPAAREEPPLWSRGLNLADDKASTSSLQPTAKRVPLTTYFLADEESMEASSTASHGHAQPKRQPKDSTYGVQSLGDTIGTSHGVDQINDDEHDLPGNWRGTKRRRGGLLHEASSSIDSRPNMLHSEYPSPPKTGRESPPSQQPSVQDNGPAAGRPLTPTYLASPGLGSSCPSSPKSMSIQSFQQSDSESIADEAANNAILSSGEEDVELATEVVDSAPQLIMPSIRMPSRRPFTEKGKNMGRLKVLIAGEAGKFVSALLRL